MSGTKKWNCKDNNDATVLQDGDQFASMKQKSTEYIIIIDSEEVDVTTTDTQAAVSLQLGLQAAIVAVVSATIGDTDRSNAVIQDLKQLVKVKQKNSQKTLIEKSNKVSVTTTDTDLAVNIQALLQVLLALVVKLDIL